MLSSLFRPSFSNPDDESLLEGQQGQLQLLKPSDQAVAPATRHNNTSKSIPVVFPNLLKLWRPRKIIFAMSLVVTGALLSQQVHHKYLKQMGRLTDPLRIMMKIFGAVLLDPFDVAFARFWRERRSPSSATYPLEIFGSVLPVPCHSHNDYWRRAPLFSALGSGCISIEADIWLQGEDLYVGHTQSSLHENATLQKMYIDPIKSILEAINLAGATGWKGYEPSGVFYNDPEQTLTLLVDLKTSGSETWSILHSQLQPLREAGWLTHWNGTVRVERPVIVVATGAVDFNVLVANSSYRDIFYDAPLDALEDESDGEKVDEYGMDDSVTRFRYNPSNSHTASAKLQKAIGLPMYPGLSVKQLERLRGQIRNAKKRHLIPRYWGTPRWPRGLRDTIWASLVQEGVGLLNADDLRAVRKGHWGIWPKEDSWHLISIFNS